LIDDIRLKDDDENQEAVIGGIDCHKKDQVGTAYTVFNNPVYSMDQLIMEIKAGNCYGRSL